MSEHILRQPPARPPVLPSPDPEPGWWVGLDRQAFYTEAAARQALMRDSKMSAYVPVRLLQ